MAQFGNTALHWAVAGGFLDVAKLLVTEGEAPLNVANEVRRTLTRSRLPVSACPPHLPLIARGPRGMGAGGGGAQYTLMTPLHWAAADGNTEMVQLLLRNGANIEAKSAVRT